MVFFFQYCFVLEILSQLHFVPFGRIERVHPGEAGTVLRRGREVGAGARPMSGPIQEQPAPGSTSCRGGKSQDRHLGEAPVGPALCPVAPPAHSQATQGSLGISHGSENLQETLGPPSILQMLL